MKFFSTLSVNFYDNGNKFVCLSVRPLVKQASLLSPPSQ